MANGTTPEVYDDDHPEFDSDGPWPRRLLHVPTMTSHKWQPDNRYGRHQEPSYHAISYTWGRWWLKEAHQKPEIGALGVKGVPWLIPRINPDHFCVAEFERVVCQVVKVPPSPFKVEHRWSRLKSKLRKYNASTCEFLWLDIACIDQRGTREGKAEVGRQARIFRGAKNVYIWLSHTSYENLLRIALDLKKNSTTTWDLDTFGSLNDAQGFKDWSGLALESLRTLVEDPWFSSLWTLQEAFLCPEAFMLARDGRLVKEDSWYILRLNYITARIHTIHNAAEQEQSQQNLFDRPDTKPLMSLIENSGLAALWQQNPMAVLTIATFRKVEFELDRVYGIMQIFGDNFKVGEATGVRGHSHQYTLLELQDEFGSMLLQHNPVLSQMHIHLEPPAFGKGWRICTVSAIPHFLSHPDNYTSQDAENIGVGDNVVVCKLSTTIVDGVVWGSLRGKACRFNALKEAWERQFYSPSNKDFDWSRRPPLNIALDRVTVLQDLSMPDLETMNTEIDEVQHGIARRLSSHLSGTRLMVFLMGQEAFDGWVMEGDSEARSDRFLGMILLQQSDHGKQYWQRLGICRWTSYRIKSAAANDPDRDILLARGSEWRDLEGVFG